MPSLRQHARGIAPVEQLGPGFITGAADDDPSGIATYSQAGAQFGYGLLWTLILNYPLMSAIQLVSAQIGRVTGRGLAAKMRAILPPWLVTLVVALLFLANTINIGPDVAAMGEAARLVTGLDAHVLTVAFAMLSLILQMFISYSQYARCLKWLTLTLLAYVAVLFVVHVDWHLALQGLVPPSSRLNSEMATTIVAVFGTTISPYMFFWQSAQEVEEVAVDPKAQSLVEAPRQARVAYLRMRLDTLLGMAASNFIALAIMATMMYVIRSRKQMHQFTAQTSLKVLGWITTAVMAVAAILMVGMGATS